MPTHLTQYVTRGVIYAFKQPKIIAFTLEIQGSATITQSQQNGSLEALPAIHSHSATKSDNLSTPGLQTQQ